MGSIPTLGSKKAANPKPAKLAEFCKKFIVIADTVSEGLDTPQLACADAATYQVVDEVKLTKPMTGKAKRWQGKAPGAIKALMGVRKYEQWSMCLASSANAFSRAADQRFAGFEPVGRMPTRNRQGPLWRLTVFSFLAACYSHWIDTEFKT